MNRKLKTELEEIYSFMAQAYSANWQTRYGETPYMPNFVSQNELDKFLTSFGKFDPVSGHTWAVMLLWTCLRRVCEALNNLVDSAEVFERICLHDLGEAKMGDVSLVNKVHRLKPDEKNLERKAFTQMTKNLPVSIKNKFLSWFDEHEGFVSGGDLRLETLMARWLDNLAGDHFTLTFGANFSKYSDIIEKIVKKRSAARGRALIDCLQKKAQIDKKKARLYLTATDEIEEVMKFHIGQIRKVGVKIDLTEFGF